MANFVSPGAYVREIDWSLYARSLSTTSVGFVGAFNKGPINEATLISNVTELVDTFGTPNPNTYAWYAIKEYLRSGRVAWVVRVADDNAEYASSDIFSNALYGSVLSTNKNIFTFESPTYGTVKGTEVETFDIDAYDAISLQYDGSTNEVVFLNSGIKSAQAIVNDINAQTSGITAYVSDGKVYIRTNTLGTSGSIELINDTLVQLGVSSVTGTFTNGETITGGTSGATGILVKLDNDKMELRNVTGSFQTTETVTGGTSSATATVDDIHDRTLPYTKLGMTGGNVYSGTDGTNKLNIQIDGGATQTIYVIPNDTNGTLSKTAQQLVNVINANLTGGTAYKTYDGAIKISTDTSGATGSIKIMSSSTAATVIGFDNNLHSGINEDKSFSVKANSKGNWGNKLQIIISAGNLVDTFRLAVIYDSKTVEVYNNLSKVQSSENYFVNKINAVSNYIEVTDNVIVTNLPAYNTYTLSGGDSGISGLNDADYIGVNNGTTKTGLQIFRNAETYMINILTVPGISSPAVVEELISLCEDRADCLAIIDPPKGLSPQTVVDWHNGTGVYAGSHTAFNSSYAALYWPWVKIYDAYNEVELWQPPSGFVVDRMAYTDRVAEPWYAAAGFNRGRLTNVLDIEYRADQGERDYMYSDGNAVNCITDFTQEGVVIWGQRTLQRAPTALDRVNVRRLVLYINKVVSSVTRYIVFEPNDYLTWARVRNALIPYFDWLYDPLTGRALYYYKIVCDETTNTPQLINNNQMSIKIYIQPTKTAEIIVSDIVLLPTGATVENYVSSNS